VEQFRDVLVVLLLIATAISAVLWAIERDAALPYEAIAIFAVVLLNAALGYVQESRAEAAVAALRALAAADATVIRDGQRQSISATARTWCSAAPPPPTGTARRSSRRPACAPRSAASPGC